MAGGFLSRFIGWRRQEDDGDDAAAQQEEAYQQGPPGPLARLPFTTSKDPWMVEWDKRRQGVVDQYWRDKKQLLRKRRSAERDLKNRLRREKIEIDQYYRLHELGRKDPRREKASRQAQRRFRLAERRLERGHREQWQREVRKLQLHRDRQKREVTKQMQRESRESRGLPPAGGLPWR